MTRGSSVTEYTYDNAGNILTKKVNGTVVGSYTYGDSNWKDLLTAYNGQSITYDGIGNPTSYIGWDELTWSMGRRLTALSNDTDSITYNYDASGQRVSKTVNGTTTEFYYDDRGTLILSKTGDTEIYFYPDADGSIGSINYLGNRYYYVRNAQNDIIGITDKTGAFVVKYTYDEWGNITSITDGNGNDVSSNASHLANLNPLRYRSYFYDAETGFYWLNTRYYNPVVGRFLNADSYASTGQGMLGHNMFAYCLNNPCSYYDPWGDECICLYKRVNSSRHKCYNYDALYGHSTKDLHSKVLNLTTLKSEEQIQQFYNEMSYSDYEEYGNALDLLFSFLPFFKIFSFLDSLFSFTGAINQGKGIMSSFSTNVTTDGYGNELYLEKGYQVITIDRIYITNDYESYYETQYAVFDRNMNCVFNKLIKRTQAFG